MPTARRRLSELRIREVALCREGMHPRANIVLYKAREPEEIEKEEPRGFRDHLETARAMEIDSALDRRLHALLATTTEIMRADVDDRETRILRAVAEYAETMERDVPDLFAGRLAKTLIQQAAEGPPSDDDVHTVVKSQLAEAGLLPEEAGGGANMDFLKTLTERGRAALNFILGDRDPAEFFKGIPEEPGKLVVGLLEKAAEWAERIDGLEADLAKAKQPPTDPNSLEAVLKAIEDPGVRTYVETQAAAVSKVSSELATLRKQTRRKELVDLAKSWTCLPNENDGLVDALEKADLAGILAPVQKALTAANEQAKVGKMLEELGVETVPGVGGGALTPEEADAALVAKATEIRKADPGMSAEKAYTLACERNQDLYLATQQRYTTAQPN